MGCQNSTGLVNDIQAKNNSNLVLGYWGLRLRGQPLRYILELSNYPYTETKYTLSQATDWFGKDKQELELDFPNLPYLIHGDFSITESSNIANYLIQLTNQQYLQGAGQDKYRVDNIRFVCDELTTKIFSSAQQKEDEKKNQLNSQILPKIKQLQKVLSNQKQFFKKLILADIYAYTTLNYFKKTYSMEYKEFAQDFDPFLKRFEEIPRISLVRKIQQIMNQYKIGYWGLPQRAQPLKFNLELANFPYTETKCTFSQATNWFGIDKQELEIEFPNLPYLIHGCFSITESSNIANYLIYMKKQQSLQGEGQDKYRVDNIRFLCDELTAKIFASTLQKDEEKKNQLKTQILPKIKQLQMVLDSQTSFFKKLTLSDIYADTTLNYFKKTYSQEYQEFAQYFDPFLKRFEEIPRIRSYHQSQRYDKL
ncbi:hypothetical protein ABPG72_002398 [Tetrahymena utriculariae]